MTLETRPFDAAKYINTPEDIADLLNDAFATGHAGYIAAAIGVAARARGMTDVAAESGLNRQALYAGLKEGGNPSLDTVMKVVLSLGLQLEAKPRPVEVD